MANGEWGGAFDQRVFRAKILFTRAGQECQTGFHLRDVGVNTLDPEDVANEVADFATTQFVKILNTADKILGIDVENLVAREGFSVSPANVPGLVNLLPAPSGAMLTVQLKGSLRRRYGSGRMFWPIAASASLNGNEVVQATRTIYDEVITDMMERFVGPAITTSMHLVHLHPELPAVQGRPLVPASWYDITSIRLSTVPSHLSSRRPGSGK